MQNKRTSKITLSEDELITIAHLRMQRVSLADAVRFIGRRDLEAAMVNSYVMHHHGGWDTFYATYGDKVHKRRQRGELPDVSHLVVRRRPANNTYHFGK